MPAICAAILEENEDAVLKAIGIAKEADFIEIRADGLRDPTHQRVRDLLKAVRSITNQPIILTNRMDSEGGAFTGTEEERIDILMECLSDADLVDIVDIELNAKRSDEVIKKAKEKGTRVIVSYHNFKDTPDYQEIINLIKEEFEIGADIAKITVTANSKEDVLSLLQATVDAEKLGGGEVCTIAMGVYGKISRIAAPVFGSSITYGYVTKETAPGQLSVGELRRSFELFEIYLG
jgi:3-dehydroquinate dehydratase I